MDASLMKVRKDSVSAVPKAGGEIQQIERAGGNGEPKRAPPVAFSLIVPAYNERERLPPYLEEVREYLLTVWGNAYEVIVVDDGSRDGLAEWLAEAAGTWPRLRALHHALNRGKGAAVRTGMLEARGEFLLYTDADGATPIEAERDLRAAIEAGADSAIGSRLVRGGDVQRERHWGRSLAGRAFARLARGVVSVEAVDTQCGFKMFRRAAGLRLFRLCREAGYLLDVEVLALASRLGYRTAEVPVTWREIPGSKVQFFRDAWRMASRLRALRQNVEEQASQECASAAAANATVEAERAPASSSLGR